MASTFNTCKDTNAALREHLAKGQAPYAIILSCSDSRLPPELIFDKSPGEIFVVRVAGNVPDPLVLGSIEYAVEHLGSSLIMVLGHERCGAVTATVEAKGHVEGNIGDIVKRIAPAAQRAKQEMAGHPKPEIVESAIDINIDMVSQNLTRQSKVLKEFVDNNKLRIIPAKFDLDTGKVSLR
jgi:carbonic anhydrase